MNRPKAGCALHFQANPACAWMSNVKGRLADGSMALVRKLTVSQVILAQGGETSLHQCSGTLPNDERFA
jgi:hypothetical protein